MPWLARRDREQFTGWIAGLGTASGHRVVVGHWPRSPYGAVTDAMIEDPAGHRTLVRTHTAAGRHRGSLQVLLQADEDVGGQHQVVAQADRQTGTHHQGMAVSIPRRWWTRSQTLWPT